MCFPKEYTGEVVVVQHRLCLFVESELWRTSLSLIRERAVDYVWVLTDGWNGKK